ncbi:hypothetical protein PR202_ga07894 [Eleusine coracana subsp. coracana]|uniref:Uncharacterized protein n=1 Tax=Eleusine coracana subsp. coracana TaxID=191504 RepID=A0AAV5BZW4_ELECO|nr:hypothetical protein PR202_ga07894 [Eleusine coracana subsp. coracana]
MAAPECGRSEGYRKLRDVRIELNSGMVRGGGEGFAFCFWLYLSSSARPSSVILHQVTENVMRLHIDGDLITETHLCSLSNEPANQNGANLITLLGSDDKLEGYVYNIEVSHILGNIPDQYVKNPPFKLSIDFSCCDGIEEGDDGIWNIVGGKASCRRNFILEVALIDAFGEPVKDKEVVASLIYDDNGTVVEKSRDDSEPPLLITCEGFEYPAISRPIPVIHGRALFKLKISQNKHARKMVASKEAHNIMGTDSSTSDGDSFDAGSSWSGSDGDDAESISDAVIFRYCLDSTYERSKFLTGAAPTVNKEDLVKLADQDLEVLRGIAGCGDDIGRGEFERLCDARAGSLQDLLLQEPELCQLGRVERLPTAKHI